MSSCNPSFESIHPAFLGTDKYASLWMQFAIARRNPYSTSPPYDKTSQRNHYLRRKGSTRPDENQLLGWFLTTPKGIEETRYLRMGLISRLRPPRRSSISCRVDSTKVRRGERWGEQSGGYRGELAHKMDEEGLNPKNHRRGGWGILVLWSPCVLCLTIDCASSIGTWFI